VTEFRKVIRVFLASPGDLQEERQRFPEIITEVNRIKANARGIQLEAVGWEDALPGVGRPQELINRDLEKCDLTVMLLWKRWGSPTGKYTSGFEEEYELARSLNETRGRPVMWLYFRDPPDDMLTDPGEQLKKVLDFRDRIEKERKFFYRPYESVDKWARSLREHLCRWLDDQPPGDTPPSTYPIGKLREYVERIEHLESEVGRLTIEHSKMASTLVQEARQKADSGQITRAEEFYAQAATSLDPGIVNEYATFLVRIGMLGKAKEKLDQVLQLSKATDDKEIEAAACNNLGIVYRILGDLNSSEEMYKRSLAVHEQLGQKRGMADAYNNLGIVYWIKGNRNTAEEMLKKALVIYEEIGYKEGMANVHGNLGNLYSYRGSQEVAEVTYKKALAIYNELGKKEGMANVYGGLGILYESRNKLDTAETMYRKALLIDEGLGRKEGIANDYGSLGNVYLARGDLDAAEKMYKKSLAIDTELGRRMGMAKTYTGLGNVHLFREEIKDAEQMYRESLAIGEELGLKEEMANDYANLGNLRLLRGGPGDNKAAEQMYMKSLSISQELGCSEHMAGDYSNLGVVYSLRGDLKSAKEMYEKSLDLYSSIGNKAKMREIRKFMRELKNSTKGK